MFCKYCGKDIGDVRFCPYCGKKLHEDSVVQKEPEPVVQPKTPKGPEPVVQPGTTQDFGQKPSMAGQGNGLKIILGVIGGFLLAVVLVVGVFVINKKDENGKMASSVETESKNVDTGTENNKSSDVLKNPESNADDDTKKPSDDSDREQVTEVGAEKGLLGYIEQRMAENNVVINSTVSMTYYGPSYTFKTDIEDGSIAALAMKDIDNDGIRELIVIYYREKSDGELLFADIIAWNDSEQRADCLKSVVLSEGASVDGCNRFIYLKKRDNGFYNLVFDEYSYADFMGDGVQFSLRAFDCTNNSFKKIADYDVAGSSVEYATKKRHVTEAKKAGLKMEVGFISPACIQDRDVELICYIGNNIFLSYYSGGFDENPKKYGEKFFKSFVNPDYSLNESDAAVFLKSEYDKYEGGIRDAKRWEEEEKNRNSEYVLPDSDYRKLTSDDMKKIKNNKRLLRIARNEIYARHGRVFKDEELQTYFEGKSWYSINYYYTNDEDILSQTERYNVRFIEKYESRLN